MMSFSPHLFTVKSIRESAQQVLELTLDQQTAFRLNLKNLDKIADGIIEMMPRQYSQLDIPLHSRWRHFEINGHNRADFLNHLARFERLKAQMDLASVSVLLDAGAGSDWQYRDKNGDLYSRSEGLALASLEMFAEGFFSAQSGQAWRVDRSVLQKLNLEQLAARLQSRPDNELAELPGRLNLLQLAAFPGERPGDLFEFISENFGKSLSAAELVNLLLLQGFNFNDIWRYPALGDIPFHKLTLWLALSLIEPLQAAGFTIHEIEKLPGLAEYRNGGLFIDGGVLEIKDPDFLKNEWRPGDPIIIEWRALTIALLDKLADIIREKLGVKAKTLPLACILQIGTWQAGRNLAYQKRAKGAPPLRCRSLGFF